jgi:hypothetical protein
VNAVNPSYLYRSGMPLDLDLQWAERLGREAVNLFSNGIDRPILLTVKKEEIGFSVDLYNLSGVDGIEGLHRFVDRRFYNPDGYSVTEESKRYLAEIVPEIPEENYGLM